MPAAWPENPRLIGQRIPRLDGMAKATGKAKYPSDMRPEGTLFGVMLYSSLPHATIKSIDTSAAEKMPGVKAVVVIVKEGATLRYQGDDIAAVAAETEEQAREDKEVLAPLDRAQGQEKVEGKRAPRYRVVRCTGGRHGG